MASFNKRTGIFLLAVALTASSTLLAMQWGGRRGRRDPDDRGGVPTWELDSDFGRDVFTFARVQYDDGGGYGRGGYGWGRGGGKWRTDMPDSDLNFSLRLHQLTSLKVNPNYAVVRLDSPELFKYPFVYMIEPGDMRLSPTEAEGLRRYCLNGGFMMVDDFWGDAWYNFEAEMKRAFPDRQMQEVPLEHPIFHMVYDLKEKPQVPAYNPSGIWRHQSYETRHYGDTTTPHYMAIYDDDDRIVVFACHNTDIGDAWEEESRDPEYFAQYSVKQAYPLGINIVTYAMTH